MDTQHFLRDYEPDFAGPELFPHTAARALGIEIVSGRYAPGDKLPTEIEAAESRGISRTTYREASRILASKGLLTSRPKVGTIVSPRSSWQLLDPDVVEWSFQSTPRADYVDALFEMRMLMEPSAAGLAAQRRTESQVAALRLCLSDMSRHRLDTEDGRNADRQFHILVMEATQNDVLVSLAQGVGAAARWCSAVSHRNGAVGRDPVVDHLRAFQAIEAGNSEAARSATVTLLLLAHEDVRHALAGQGSLEVMA